MSHHQSVSHRFLIGALLVNSLWVAACSGEITDTPELQQGFAPLCGDPVHDAGQPDPPQPDSAPPAPPTPQFDCEVRLSKLSYDSPGADSAEFLELRIDGTVDSAGQHATLGDCGLDHIGLLNGGDANCASYRQIPVATLPVPNDGYFVLCSSDAQAALGITCDLSSWGTSRLANGWLQNGPNDVIALIGETQTHYAYEGVPPQCGDASWFDLPADTGEVIDGADDVITACGDEFLRMSLLQAPLHGSAQCPVTAEPDAGASAPSTQNPNGEAVPGSAGPTGEGSPSNPSSGNGDGSSADGGITGHAQLLDASVTQPSTVAMQPEAAAPTPLWNTYGTNTDASAINTPQAPRMASGCNIGLYPEPNIELGGRMFLLALTLCLWRRQKMPHGS